MSIHTKNEDKDEIDVNGVGNSNKLQPKNTTLYSSIDQIEDSNAIESTSTVLIVESLMFKILGLCTQNGKIVAPMSVGAPSTLVHEKWRCQ